MLTRLSLALLVTLFSGHGWAEAYYWVDDQGKRHYSDCVPAKESKRERKIIDERGYTVETLPEQKTEAENRAARAAQAAAEKQRREEDRKRAESAAYDKLLLTTYDNVEEIEHERDDRLSLTEGSLLVAEQTHTDNSKRLNLLREQEKALLAKGQPVTDKLRKSIADVLNRIKVNERAIVELQRQRSETAAKYQRDINRYNELTSAAN